MQRLTEEWSSKLEIILYVPNKAVIHTMRMRYLFNIYKAHRLLLLDLEALVTYVVNIYLNMFGSEDITGLDVNSLALNLSHYKASFLSIGRCISPINDMIQATSATNVGLAIGSSLVVNYYPVTIGVGQDAIFSILNFLSRLSTTGVSFACKVASSALIKISLSFIGS
ncbi:unnamed protein product [Sphenostylis stenocarpa]|uniref:Uncharacterized protein n=1 Tax=Sphenostylis stenocarpa TaxID=92480 RepID=A0AA86SCJ8_9FABA|nr:unnamed protein product [Sphenostylis stenocarpa]